MVRVLRSAAVLMGLAVAACGGETTDAAAGNVDIVGDAAAAGGLPAEGAGGSTSPPSGGGAPGASGGAAGAPAAGGAPDEGDAAACDPAIPDRTTGAPAPPDCPCLSVSLRRDPSGDACGTPGTYCEYDTVERCWIVSCECMAGGAWSCMQLLC